jgi:hypothetical protein
MLQTDNKTIFTYSGISTARSLLISMATHPLDVIKTQQQDSPDPRKIKEIFQTIRKENGFRGFYSGLSPKVTMLLMRDWWRWPTIICLPGYLEKNYSLSAMQSQMLAGVFISTLDTASTAPFERRRVQLITGTTPLKGNFFSHGWKGFTPYWCRATIGWMTFSSSQRFLRDKYKEFTHKTELNTADLILIGIGVGFITSFGLAPFDLANTLGQSRDITMRQLWKNSGKINRLWRGAQLQALISSIHHITSVMLIDKLSPEFD